MEEPIEKIEPPAPGVYSDISFKDYLAFDAVSNSYLGRLDKCPAAAQVPVKETPAMILGRATHALVLEGKEVFDKTSAILPDINRRTNAGKAEYADFQLANVGKSIITKDQADDIKLMRLAVEQHPAAGKILKEGLSEQTVIWKDKGTGLICKSRVDRSPKPSTRVLADLKTAASADSRLWFNKAHQFGYFRQGGLYLDAVNSHIEDPDKHFTEFIFIVVEKEPPYRVEVYGIDADMDDSMLAWGREEYKRLMHLEVQCRKNELYPHYQDPGIQMLYRPKWLS